jgi:hypothetical protein
VDAEVGRARQQPFDLIECGVGVAGYLRKDLGAIFSRERAP